MTIAGYSPYKDIGELLYPPGVKDEPNKWGFVTRLLHLDDIVDGNSPFELFKITEAEHFKLDKGQVDLDADMPAGIGTVEFKSAKPILVDPMTKEVINKVAVLDEYGTEKLDRTGKPVYQINDYWFILNVKFIWKDAPKQEVQTQDISIDSRGRPIRVRSGSGGRVR